VPPSVGKPIVKLPELEACALLASQMLSSFCISQYVTRFHTARLLGPRFLNAVIVELCFLSMMTQFLTGSSQGAPLCQPDLLVLLGL
jgi:hypothetical protein